MQEKRKLVRKHPVYYLKAIDRQTEENLGYLIDINVQGLMLAGKSAMPVGITRSIIIHLPRELKDQKVIFLKVTSIWSEFDPVLEKFKSGYQIVDHTPEEKEKIEILIKDYGFKE